MKGPRRIDFDPHTTANPGLVLSLYGIAQFLVSVIMYGILMANVKEWHVSVIASGTVLIIATLTTLGWIFEAKYDHQ